MKTFKVLVISILLKNNQIANYGDEVTEDQLSGDAETLKKGGYIGVLTKADIEAKKKADADAKKKADKDAEEASKKAEEEAEAQRLIDEQTAKDLANQNDAGGAK